MASYVAVLRRKYFSEKRIKSELLAQAKFEFLQRICEKEIKKLTKNSETVVLSYNLYSHYSIRVLAFSPSPKNSSVIRIYMFLPNEQALSFLVLVVL